MEQSEEIGRDNFPSRNTVCRDIMQGMRVSSRLVLLVVLAGSLYGFADEFVNASDAASADIAQHCYTNPPPCESSFYFEAPKDAPNQPYFETPCPNEPSSFVDILNLTNTGEKSPAKGAESVQKQVIGGNLSSAAPRAPISSTPIPEGNPQGFIYNTPASLVQGQYKTADCLPSGEGFTVNFENIAVGELLQFISQISGINFIYNPEDIQFNITIVSQEAASVSELTSALLQILKMHNLSVAEQGNTVLVYKQQNLSRVSKIITDQNVNESCDAAVITRVFRLYNVDPKRIAEIIKPLLSTDAIVEVSEETRHLIVSDITYNVDKIAQLLNALDTPNTFYEVGEYHVKGAYPEALVAYAKEILAPLLVDNPMQMIAQPSARKIFVVSTPYLIHKAIQLLASLDSADVTDVADLPPSSIENNSVYMYKLKYQPGKDIATALQAIGSNLQYAGVANMELVNTMYSAQFLQVNNSIVVTGTQNALQKVVNLLDELDQPPKQVYLEVLILDTTLTNSLDFGVQWIGLGDEQDKLAYATGLLSNNPAGGPVLQGGTSTNPGARYVATNGAPPIAPNPGRDVALPTPAQLQGYASMSNLTEAFGFGIIGNILSHNGTSFLTLGALISALEEEQNSKLVLNPRIMVQDTQTADIFVGENIPYQTTSSVIQQTGSVTQNIQYEDVGVHLQITPTIAPNNIVSLDINQTIASVVGGVSGTLTPTTAKTLTTTRVHVPDGCFLVMSGHISDQVTTTTSGVPCLGSLPLIGPTFSRNVDQRQKRNLIMFIRPKVITNINQGLDLTNQEGYDSNWEEDPNSMIQCGPKRAPECETYPAPRCPPN